MNPEFPWRRSRSCPRAAWSTCGRAWHDRQILIKAHPSEGSCSGRRRGCCFFGAYSRLRLRLRRATSRRHRNALLQCQFDWRSREAGLYWTVALGGGATGARAAATIHVDGAGQAITASSPKKRGSFLCVEAFGRQRDSGRIQLAKAMAFALLALAAMIRLSCAVGASWQEPLLRGVKADSGSARRALRT